MQALNYLAIKLISILSYPLLSSLYNMVCGKRTLTRVSIMVPNMCANDLKNNLTSQSTVVCNLDAEVDIEIDEDDKHKKTSNNTLNVSRTVYNKGKDIITDLEDIFLNTSNATTTILYISCDYRLLKYCGVVNIEYFMPSDAYHTELMKQKDWNESAYQVTKQDLVDRKKDKLHIYTSASDLQSQVLVLYPSINLKI